MMLWVWWLVSLRVGCPGLVFGVAVVVFLAVVTVARWLEECVAVYRLVWTKDCPGVPLRDDGSELKPPITHPSVRRVLCIYYQFDVQRTVRIALWATNGRISLP